MKPLDAQEVLALENYAADLRLIGRRMGSAAQYNAHVADLIDRAAAELRALRGAGVKDADPALGEPK